MLAYSAAVFQNCGNYKSFGDTKFVPELSPESFRKIVQASEGYKQNGVLLEKILDRIQFEVFEEHEKFAHIGFRDDNGVTNSYYSSNITKADATFIDEWCQELKLSPLNTRLLKTDENTYELLVASKDVDAKKTPYLKKYEKDGKTMYVTGQDFAVFMNEVVQSMAKAKEYTANENQLNMCKAYEEHF
jgi:dipeptidyl-peptidase-3